ncbi:hypothetical protein Tco_0600796 [Tanacetum coccineum]
MPIFKRTFSQDLDLLENHLTKEIISQTDCKTTLTKLRTTFENAFNSELKARMQNYTRYDAQSYDAMIFNMDSLRKYMLELILHQQRTPQLLKQKKLMQTQEDHSNPIPVLNVDSLKVDLVVIQNTCSEKEDSNSETASSKLVKDTHTRRGTQSLLNTIGTRGSTLQRYTIPTPEYVKKSVAERTRHQRHNKAKIEKEIDVLETMNIELEHSVATLRKENETLKQHYKDLYDSIKITRSKTTDTTTTLIANNCLNKSIQIPGKRKVIRLLHKQGTSINVQKEQSLDLSAELESLFGPLFDEYFNGENQVVLKSFAVTTTDASNKRQQQPDSTSSTSTLATTVTANGNFDFTQHYLPKKTESAFAKPDHMIASSSSRNSSKNMPRFSSNDMVHNYYLDIAKKKIQESDRNSKSSVMPTARFQSTTDDSIPKPRSNNQTPRSLPVSKSSCVTITTMTNADHSKSSSSFSDSKQFIFTRHRFSPNKTSAVYEKTSPRYDLRWKPTGRIFKSDGLRWISTGKLFDSYISKVDSEPPHGSNVDIPNIHECKQTLDVSAGTSINVQKEQSLDLSAVSTEVHQAAETVTTSNELDLLFGPLFDEYFNGENLVVSKSSAVTTADASDKRQQQPDSTSSTSTLATTVTANGNFDL